MKTLFALFAALTFISLSPTAAQTTNNRVQAEDIATLLGEWEGVLTYRNYRDGKLFDVRTNLQITAGKDANELLVQNNYPDEPKAGGSYTIRIKKNGTRINKERVISRKTLDDGKLEVVTEYKGRDDNKKAIIRIT